MKLNLLIIRIVFIIVSFILPALVFLNTHSDPTIETQIQWYYAFFGPAIAIAFICMEIVFKKRFVRSMIAITFGLMIGIVVTYMLSILISNLMPKGMAGEIQRYYIPILGVVICYLSINLVLNTHDDFRMIIPYIDFREQASKYRGILLDTSVLIDGRILELCKAGIFDTKIMIPKFVLAELQTLSDSADKLKRERGRRGLDLVQEIQNSTTADVVIMESDLDETPGGVDEKLLKLSILENAKISTTDFNLNKVATVQGIAVININDLANAMRAKLTYGDTFRIEIVKEGGEPGQGVGYLEDGTMVVVENGRNLIGKKVKVSVTSFLQTAAGRMVFAKADVSTVRSNEPSYKPAPKNDGRRDKKRNDHRSKDRSQYDNRDGGGRRNNDSKNRSNQNRRNDSRQNNNKQNHNRSNDSGKDNFQTDNSRQNPYMDNIPKTERKPDSSESNKPSSGFGNGIDIG